MNRRRRRLVALGAGVLLAAGLVAYLVRPRAAPAWREEISAERMSELAALSGRITRAELTEALAIVDPLGQLRARYQLEGDTLAIRDEGVSVRIRLAAARPARPAAPRRVILDPGHHGGAWAAIEERLVSVPGLPDLREGDLTYATARHVQDQLGKRGFETAMTRGAPPTTAYPAGADRAFDLERELPFALASTPEAARAMRLDPGAAAAALDVARARLREHGPFPVYTHYDLRRRSELAERLAPATFVSLHFNALESAENGIVVFVPGNCMDGELATRSQRYHAWRRILDGSLEGSIALARRAGRAMQRLLQLPALRPRHHGPGESLLAVDVEAGVYARNLAVLRRSPGVAVLLEGPSLTNPDEALRVSDRPEERARSYGEAVVTAIADVP